MLLYLLNLIEKFSCKNKDNNIKNNNTKNKEKLFEDDDSSEIIFYLFISRNKFIITYKLSFI